MLTSIVYLDYTLRQRDTPSMVVGTLRLLADLGVPDADIEVEAFRGYG